MFDDGEKSHKKEKEAGVDITFRAGVGMVHCYPLLAPQFKEAAAAMKGICNFIVKHTEKN
jgi:epsilon-lactone hydrolase